MMSRSSRIRSAPLALATAVVWLVAVAAAIGDLFQLVTILRGRAALSFGFGEGNLPLDWLPQVSVAQLRDGSAGNLVDAPLWVRILAAGPSLAHLATILIACLLVVRIINGIARGLPFGEHVLRSWKWLIVTLLAGSTLQGLCDVVARRVIAGLITSPTDDGGWLFGADYAVLLVARPDWPILLTVLGIIAATLAIAFQTGARLEREVEGVV